MSSNTSRFVKFVPRYLNYLDYLDILVKTINVVLTEDYTTQLFLCHDDKSFDKVKKKNQLTATGLPLDTLDTPS